jgi:hypothetical protein
MKKRKSSGKLVWICLATDESAQIRDCIAGSAEGIFCPRRRGCDLVSGKSEPLNALLAIATDLLAQFEAQQRTATRLDTALRQLSRDTRVPREQAGVAPAIDIVRTHVRTLRDLFDAERALLDELERELASASR